MCEDLYGRCKAVMRRYVSAGAGAERGVDHSIDLVEERGCRSVEREMERERKREMNGGEWSPKAQFISLLRHHTRFN